MNWLKTRLQYELKELLVRENLVPIPLLQRALRRTRKQGGNLADVLLELGALSEEPLLAALSQVYDLPSINLEHTDGDPMVLSLLSKEQAIEYQAMPLFLVERQLSVAMADPEDIDRIDKLSFATGKEVRPVVALPSQLRSKVEEFYGSEEMEHIDDLEFESAPSEETEDSRLELVQAEEERPIVRLVNMILLRAVHDSATDIHLEPEEDCVAVRLRVDGRLQTLPHNIPVHVGPAIVSRIKVLAKLDIAEHRRPQDGKFALRLPERRIDIRVSTCPSVHGQTVVMRLLDQSRNNFSLDNIGLEPVLRERWQRLSTRREGMLLVTGPTGSGKTSTLFASLRKIQDPEISIFTLEDPVEYQIDGVTQAQVNEKAGFDFATGLRSILRQDPDVILVGEIRDAETARIATQASLTGHLVLASLHTNDAPSAVVRLIDLGVPPYLVAASLLGVLGQRLVRRVCPECSRESRLEVQDQGVLGPWSDYLGGPGMEGAGCKSCSNTGCQGRMGVHELMAITPELRGLIGNSADGEELRRAAAKDSYRPMWWDGLDKVKSGSVSLRELSRDVEMPASPSHATSHPTLGFEMARHAELPLEAAIANGEAGRTVASQPPSAGT